MGVAEMRRLATLATLAWVVVTCCNANVVTVRQPGADCLPVGDDAVALEAEASGAQPRQTPPVLLAHFTSTRPRCPPGFAWTKGKCRRVVRCKPAGSRVETTGLQTDRSYWRWFAVKNLHPLNSFAAARG